MERMLRGKRSLQSALNNRQGSVGNSRKVTELCWMILALVLFMVMGPFAAPVAVFAVLGLPAEERGESEPELLSEPVRYQLR